MVITDDIGTVLTLDKEPKRIISLVPSITELLVDLGLEKQLVGITKFCVHPANLRKEKTIIGGTKNTHLHKINSLAPDLIIANKEENVKEQAEAMQVICPVFTSEVKTIEHALKLVKTIGKITRKETAANHLINSIQDLRKPTSTELKSVAYIIWKDPLMSIGRDTFIHSMLSEAGFTNVFADQLRYPTLDKQQLLAIKPDIIFLASEPFPFKDQHIKAFEEDFPGSSIRLIDGEMVSWYGSRMLQGIPYLQKVSSLK